jgi:hypothetical protein
MKKIILFAIVITAGFTINLSAQSAATISATDASAGLLVSMMLSETTPLSFGSNLLSTSAGGTVVLPSNSTTRIYSGGVATSAATPVATIAAYNVNGTALETYAIVLPSLVTVSHTSVSSGVYTMNITSMKTRFNGADTDGTTSTLAANGTDSFTLGGTLTVKEDQIGGEYSGTFQVSVDYN